MGIEKKTMIRRFRRYLDNNMSQLVIYTAFLKIIFGIFLILKFNLRSKPFFALLGLLIVLFGPFLVGIFASILHKIVIKLDDSTT